MTALCDLAGLFVGHPTFIEGLRDVADRQLSDALDRAFGLAGGPPTAKALYFVRG